MGEVIPLLMVWNAGMDDCLKGVKSYYTGISVFKAKKGPAQTGGSSMLANPLILQLNRLSPSQLRKHLIHNQLLLVKRGREGLLDQIVPGVTPTEALLEASGNGGGPPAEG